MESEKRGFGRQRSGKDASHGFAHGCQAETKKKQSPNTHCGITNIRCRAMTTEKFNSLTEADIRENLKKYAKKKILSKVFKCQMKKKKEGTNCLFRKHEESIEKHQKITDVTSLKTNVAKEVGDDFNIYIFNQIIFEKLKLFSKKSVRNQLTPSPSFFFSVNKTIFRNNNNKTIQQKTDGFHLLRNSCRIVVLGDTHGRLRLLLLP